MLTAFIALICDEARRIWCYKWLAAVVSVVVLCAGAAFVYYLPPVYDAWAQIFVNKQTRIAAAAQGGLSAGDNANLVAKTLLNDQGLEQVARRTHPAGRAMSKRELAQTVAGLKRSIEFSDQGDGFFEFHVKDHDAVRAQRIAQQLLNDFVARIRGDGADDLRMAGAFLDTQIASYETMLANSRARLVQFQQEHRGLGGRSGAAAAYSDRVDLDRAPLVYDTAAAPQAQAPAEPSISDTKVSALEAKLANLRLEYTEQHPDVVILKRQLAQAEAERQAEVRAGPGSGEALKPALRSVPSLTVARPRTGAAVAAPMASPAVQSEWAELLKNDEFLRLNYQELVSRREAARMSQAAYGADANKFQIIRRPTTPETPVGPKRKLYLLAVVIAAIGAGLGASYLRAAVEGIFVSPRELEQIFDLPVVGTVSWEPAWNTASRRPRGRPGRAVSKHVGTS